MPEQPRRLRVVFRRTPDANPDGPGGELLDRIAHGLASRALATARAEAEAALGRPFRHEPEPEIERSPVDALKERALRGS